MAVAAHLLLIFPARAVSNVLSSPGFEGLPTGAVADNGGGNKWGNYNDSPGNCIIQSTIVHSGTNALELNVHPTGSQGYSIFYQNTGATVASNAIVNRTWYYSFYVLAASGNGSFTWAFMPSDSLNEDKPGASATVAASALTAGAWKQISGSFTTTTYSFGAGATPNMKAQFSQTDSAGAFYIDDVVLSTNALPAPANTVPPAPTDGITVTTDPTGALTNYTGLGEWTNDGDFENWATTNIGAASVSGGLLAGTAGDNNPQIALTGLGTNGPDLDLAFNDYLDVRLQVPAGFAGGIQIYFGATNNYFYTANATTGFNANRSVTITNAPTDGAFHVYRVFFGPHPYWRGNLSDVRIDPLGNSAAVGEAFALDYVRVGDLAGDVYTPVYGSLIPAPGVNNENGFPIHEMDSKHFRFCWDAPSTSNSYWNAGMPHGTLRNFEEVWKSHVWRMGWPEPDHPVGANHLTYTGPKHKVSITTYYSGYFTGADDKGTAWVNITPDGLVVDPPTWVPPHEFTHACQESANDNGAQVVDGQFWENNANYGREQWLYHYPWETNQSGLDPNYPDTSHFWLGHGRNYYLCWPFWVYLDENPDHLPGLGSSYGSFFSVQLWEQANPGEYLWDTLARLAPATSVQDIIGYVARRDVEWDYSHRAALTNAAATGDAEFNARWTDAELRQRADDPTWWQTPIEFAPQQGGYKIVRLLPQGTGDGRVVSVNFHGLPDSVRGADWRAAFVVVSDNGAVRYSPLWNAGLNSVTLAANENTVYLSVAGTPEKFLLEAIDEALQAYPSSPAKARFPYEVQVTGATPFESSTVNTTGITLIKVANGGGYRAATATVDATAFVGPNARVLGTAQVRGNARILDYAVVEGSAVVSGDAVVSGHALVRNNAVVRDNAKVRDYGMVTDNSIVAGYGRVLQHGQITGGSVVTNWATVKGSAVTFDDGATTLPQAWNDAVLDGDFSTSQSCSNGFQFGFEEYNDGPLIWITNRAAPRRLYAAYEFNAPHDSLAKDLFGVTDGYLQGNPKWVNFDGQRRGFLTFDGASQFVILDRSLSDLPEITVSAWVKWSGGAANQPVWYFGSATNFMYLTPSDASGHAAFSIVNAGATQTVAWTNPLPVGVWTHVAVTLSNATTGRLYINGANVSTGAITNTPDQLNAPDVNTAPAQNYLARGAGASLPFFQGALDSVRVYTGALTDAEIAAMQPPASFGGAGVLYVDLRATNAAASAITYSIWTNLGSAVGNFSRAGIPAYLTNVAGTGVPGVYFDGSSARYASGNVSIAELTGAGDRTLEVWAYNPSLQTEETLVSLGDRNGTRRDCALNFAASPDLGAAAELNDDVPWGAMGFPSTNGWHHLVYTYDGNVTAKIYVDGQQWFTHTLSGPLATPQNEPIHIGCQNGNGQLFSGYINSVRVWGGAMTASQVTSNYLFGPWTLPPQPKAIYFAPIPNITVNPGSTVNVTNLALDPNLPPLPLSFGILSAPNGAVINATNGLLTWTPGAAQANTSNLVTLLVTNNGSPGLSATQSFIITVASAPSPIVSNIQIIGGHIQFQIDGGSSSNATVQTATNLSNPDWLTIFSAKTPSAPFNWTDTNSDTDAARFYRVLLTP
jgi:hypothetical protein